MMKWKLMGLLIFLGYTLNVNAQSAGNSLTAGYDTTAFNPVFIQSQNGDFNFHLGAYTQFRYNLVVLENAKDGTESVPRGYNLARTRIFMEGDVTPQFHYHLRANINASNQMELMVAYLQWNLSDQMHLRLGKQFMALGREDWMFPQDLASIDFSAHDFTYAIWSSFGVQYHHTANKHLRYWVGIGNGAYGGRRSFPDPKDSDIALTFRTDWNILGSDWAIYDDMLGRRGREFGMLLGVGLGHNWRFDPEALKTDPKTAYQINIDYTISGDGYQFFIHGTTTGQQFEDNKQPGFSVNGLYSTFGYWMSNKVFTYARFDYNGKGDHPKATEDYISPGLGVSLYPFEWTNRIRFTLEYNHLSATVSNTVVEPDGMLGLIDYNRGGQQSFRFQCQFGF